MRGTPNEYRLVHVGAEGGTDRPFVRYRTDRIEVELGTSVALGVQVHEA